MNPQRIRMSVRRGWRLPANTVRVDELSEYGNPFWRSQGSAIERFYWYCLLISGYHNCSVGLECGKRQDAHVEVLKAAKAARWRPLRGKNLACTCEVGKPCHADALLEIVNRKPRQHLDMTKMIAKYGYRFENGRPYRIADAFKDDAA
jgi:hypothetical protein